MLNMRESKEHNDGLSKKVPSPVTEVESGPQTVLGCLFKQIHEAEDCSRASRSSTQSHVDIVTRPLRKHDGNDSDDVGKSPGSAHEDQIQHPKLPIALPRRLWGATLPVPTILEHSYLKVPNPTLMGAAQRDNNTYSYSREYLDARKCYSTSPGHNNPQHLDEFQNHDIPQGEGQHLSNEEDPKLKNQESITTRLGDISASDSSTEVSLESYHLQDTQVSENNWEENHEEDRQLSLNKAITTDQLNVYLTFSPPDQQHFANSNSKVQLSNLKIYGHEDVRRQESKTPSPLHDTDELDGRIKYDKEVISSHKRKKPDYTDSLSNLRALSDVSLEGVPAQSRQSSSAHLKHNAEQAEIENKTHISDDESVLSPELLDSYLRFKAAEKIPRTQVDVAYERGVVEGRKQQEEKTKGLILLLLIIFAFARLDIWLSGMMLMFLIGIGKFLGLFD